MLFGAPLRRDRKEWLLIEGDPLRLVGGDHMIQGRHAREALVIFTLLTQADPRVMSGVGEDVGLGSVGVVLPKAAIRM